MKLGSGCYYFSRDRMGWIEAKKTCELMTEGGRLVHIETPAERDLLLKQVAKQSRSRFEYWTAGNDIDEENRWVWAGGEADKVREVALTETALTQPLAKFFGQQRRWTRD